MARRLDRLRGRDRTPAVPRPPAEDGAPPPPPPPGALRRERRALSRVREERIRDLGGLALEMVRRNRFRQELLVEQCREILVLESRIHEIEALLARVSAGRRRRGERCDCGAPLEWGAHFCANCGRPTGTVLVSCAQCDTALPAGARFCSNCGAVAAETARSDQVAASYEQTAHGEKPWGDPPADDAG
ncbi:MAG: zinc ribbon domain-containing protein [Thermoleophilia bacterium]|nr:zinc ribbon domain-containing protein [Thermoleophilia bacterium]